MGRKKLDLTDEEKKERHNMQQQIYRQSEKGKEAYARANKKYREKIQYNEDGIIQRYNDEGDDLFLTLTPRERVLHKMIDNLEIWTDNFQDNVTELKKCVNDYKKEMAYIDYINSIEDIDDVMYEIKRCYKEIKKATKKAQIKGVELFNEDEKKMWEVYEQTLR